MSLLETCIDKINSNKERIKNLEISLYIINKINTSNEQEQIKYINKLLVKYYDKHSYIHEYTEMRTRQIDKLPIIKEIDKNTNLFFFDRL